MEAEASRLASFEKLAAFIETASLAFFEDGASVLSLTRRARAALESAAALDGSLSPLEQRLSNLFYEADDIAAELRLYRDSLSFDPSRQETVEERLSFIQKLKKKYVKTALVEGGEKSFTTVEDAILAYRDEALAEIEALSASDENREKLKNEVLALEKEIALKARSISAKRLAASSNLSAMISAVLRRLGMNAAKFSVRLAPKTPEGAGRMLLGPYGADDVEFLFSANAGEPEKELARIASGGELSRVMLAIKATLASGGLNNAEKPEKSELFPGALNTTAAQKSDSSPDTLIFDEIDTGIGGEVAIAVGEELTRISKGKQVFCITHIASIAARAAHHILVEKASDGRRTVTTVRSLSGEARRAEIARLLAGSKDETALAHAGELLAKWAV
ncbi:MAG: hypothetical protein Pg6A_04540 [Termitinemataceae bacterium]|nr:MAG: hypothetical protein Pg6A_04540 [Termitinemataceae bacterium]